MNTPSQQDNSANKELLFSELFWSLWEQLDYDKPTDTNYCYIFEVFSSKQKFVVRKWQGGDQNSGRIILHGVRNMTTLEEADPRELARKHNWECVREYPEFTHSSVEEIVAKANTLDPLKQEGFVVVDSKCNRLKIRSPQWTALSLLSWFNDKNTNERLLVELARKGRRNSASTSTEGRGTSAVAAYDSEEFLLAFPEWEEEFKATKRRYERAVSHIEKVYRTLEAIEDKAQFASAARQHFFYGDLFLLKASHPVEEGGDDQMVWNYFAVCYLKKVVNFMRRIEGNKLK